MRDNVCHYKKWDITEDLSLRFYYSFQARKDYANQYYLKAHKSKSYQLIDNKSIIQHLKSLSKDKIPTEVIGRTINGRYLKTLFKADVGIGSLRE